MSIELEPEKGTAPKKKGSLAFVEIELKSSGLSRHVPDNANDNPSA
jgi:hypothetical protein